MHSDPETELLGREGTGLVNDSVRENEASDGVDEGHGRNGAEVTRASQKKTDKQANPGTKADHDGAIEAVVVWSQLTSSVRGRERFLRLGSLPILDRAKTTDRNEAVTVDKVFGFIEIDLDGLVQVLELQLDAA